MSMGGGGGWRGSRKRAGVESLGRHGLEMMSDSPARLCGKAGATEKNNHAFYDSRNDRIFTGAPTAAFELART